MLGSFGLILALGLIAGTNTSSHYTYIVKDDSWLSLSGSSSINTFECISNSEVVKGNLVVNFDEINRTLNFTNAQLKIDVKSFNCKNPLLNKDLHKALGADKNPYITIELMDAITKTQSKSGQTGSIVAKVSVTINQKCKIVDIPIQWQQVGSSRFRFSGFKELNMSDFEINPPSPAFGLVKVSNEIAITFSLLVEANAFEAPRILSESL